MHPEWVIHQTLLSMKTLKRRTDRNAWWINLYSSRSLRIGYSKSHHPWDHERSHGHEEGLCTVGIELVDTNSPCQLCGLSWRAAATEQSKSDQVFDCIITDDEPWIHHCNSLSQLEAKVWRRLGEQTPTRGHQERSAGKIMMIIFWDKGGVLHTEYLPRETTINGPSDASIIERLHSVIVEKGRGKVSCRVLLLHDNAPIHKHINWFEIFNFVQSW